VLAKRYGGWYAQLVRKSGKETKTGIEVAQMVIAERTNRCPVIIDAGGGYGGDAASKLDSRASLSCRSSARAPRSVARTIAPTGSTTSAPRRGGVCARSLDPEQEFGSAVSLPPGVQIKADLAAPTWSLHPTRGILVEDMSDIKKCLGRSCDDGDAIVLCLSLRAPRRPPGRPARIHAENAQLEPALAMRP
jgi:hypothetical protein